MAPVRLAITLGDPRGIGPEIVAAALQRLRADEASVVLVGPEGTGASAADFDSVGKWSLGAGGDVAGRLAGLAIERAVSLALNGDVDAIVTAPIDKAALHAGGYDFPGHTEMLAALSGVPSVVMMMAAERTALGGPLRVVLATTHLRLADVPQTLTSALLVEQTQLTYDGLVHGWEITEPRIAMCAFNPHASDGGLFGDEEARIMQPAIDALARRGIQITGPVPADTVFIRAIRGEFDAVIAPYHDVGMAAFKTASFGAGVNITLGLPFTRTSPDHGTAIDIAGSGRADSSSMEEAIRVAIKLAQRKSTKER